MKIALDAQLASAGADYRSAGVSGYSAALLRELGALRAAGATRHQFVAFVNHPDIDAPGVKLVRSRLPLGKPPLRIAWEQAALPMQLARRGFDLVHGLVNVLPLASTTRPSGLFSLPGVVTVHDLSFVRMPEVLPRVKRAYLTALCRASTSQARRVIAVSRQTADDLIAAFGLASARIDVVPNGVSDHFAPAPGEDLAAFRRARRLPDRFLLYVGTLEPRKNLERLVRAYGRWRTANPADDDVALVLAGAQGWFFETIFQTVRELGLQDQVLFPGFVPAAELPSWYRAALGFVYPSRFEGFGLPVLEAMASGTPVITSRAPALLEVAGDAALTVAADDEAGLADCINLLVDQSALRAELARRGLARAASYSWARTARETVQVYEEAVR